MASRVVYAVRNQDCGVWVKLFDEAKYIDRGQFVYMEINSRAGCFVVGYCIAYQRGNIKCYEIHNGLVKKIGRCLKALQRPIQTNKWFYFRMPL